MHFTETPPLKTDKIYGYILGEYGRSYSASGAAKLMKRLGFVYKKPIALATQVDEVAQQAFIDLYDALMNSLLSCEKFLFSGTVHPEYQNRPAHGWFPKGQKTAIKTTSGRKRFNIQDALDLETFTFTYVQGETINAKTNLLNAKIDRERLPRGADNSRHSRQCALPSCQGSSAMA